jgi:hypothetical protein
MQKLTTGRISLKEPDEERLKQELVGRDISQGLFVFLKNLLRSKKWTRKINIPSGHTDVAAVLVFTSQLKEAGLEILSELHVFCRGQTRVEKWEVCGENEEIYRLPKEAFMAIEIDKVRVNDSEVSIAFRVPTSAGNTETLIRIFDFSDEASGFRVVPHPLLQCLPLNNSTP